MVSHEFTTTIKYQDCVMDVTVEYTFHKGTTLAGGDDPDHVDVKNIYNQSGHKIGHKLPENVYEELCDLVYEYELQMA